MRHPRKRPFVLLLAALLGGTALIPSPSMGQPPGDVLPYRLAFGKPTYTQGLETACFVFLQGGRLRVRITGDGASHRISGEIRTSHEGVLEDVTPLSEKLVVRQLRPGRILFDHRGDLVEDGFDVTLAGSFSQVTLDLTVDGASRPDLLRIGEGRASPSALPARLELRNPDSTWVERFGF